MLILDSTANENEKEGEAKMKEGEHIRVTTMAKMQLIRGELCVTNRAHKMHCRLTQCVSLGFSQGQTAHNVRFSEEKRHRQEEL